MKYCLKVAVIKGVDVADWRLGGVRTKKELLSRARKLNLFHILCPDGNVILCKDALDFARYQELWVQINEPKLEREEKYAEGLLG